MKVGLIAMKMNTFNKELLNSFDTMYVSFFALAGYILPKNRR
jgi:hypothetical protein